MDPQNIYNEICKFSPTSEQIMIFQVLSNWNTSENPLLIRLPCGYGKTESVVLPFLNQAMTNRWLLAPRMIYILPTRALCNQIRNRISQYAEKTGKKIIVGIEHGTSSLDPLFFSDICVTTFDQFLYGYARAKRQVGRHFDLPAGAIANSVVVFDEAHLYSPYTHSLMRAMIEILVASRIPTVIMTATMPKTLETDLVGGVNEPAKIDFVGEWPDFIANRFITWRQEDWGLLNGENLSDELNNLLQCYKNKRVLIVVNRIDTAQKIARQLRGRDEFITLIHSRFTVEDREQKEKDVCRYFGKKKEEQKPGIVVSTQVCEVGLDISCDILITECASADALVQRVGRVARWGGSGEVVIVRPMGNDDPLDNAQWGAAYPYVDKTKDDETEFLGIKRGEFAGIAWEFLRQKAPKNLFIDWSTIADFCNKMDYHTGDVEARGALGQLFDATLYADERPWNLSARGELYCTVAVISADRLPQAEILQERESKKRGKRQREKTEQQIPYQELQKHLVNIPFRYLFGKDTKDWRKYDFREGKSGDKLNKSRPGPFQTYLIDSADSYHSDIGLTLPRRENPDETEEGTSCLIL